MTLILDTVSTLGAPNSFVLFDDTDGRTVWYAPKTWRLDTSSGKPAISYYEDQADDVAFLQMILAPWFDQGEFDSVKTALARQGRILSPVRYLGKNDQGQTGSNITVIASFPPDPRFRFQVNGGQGGILGNPVPIVMSMNYTTGRILKGMVQSQDIGMVMQFQAMLRGATTTFHAVVEIDYDRTYEYLSLHASVNWWVWSSDWQAAWQWLTENGAVKVTILGGTPDQKTLVYQIAEKMRDIFFKPELSKITSPAMPSDGFIRTSVTYEKDYEHKNFRLEFNEMDFVDALYSCGAFTGRQDFGAHKIVKGPTPLVASLYAAAAAGGSRVQANFIDWSLINGLPALLPVLGQIRKDGEISGPAVGQYQPAEK